MSIEKIINEAWENKDQVSQNSDKSLKDAVNQIIDDGRKPHSILFELFSDKGAGTLIRK